MSNLVKLMQTQGEAQEPHATVVTMPRPVFETVPAKLPSIFRVESVERHPSDHHQVVTRAVLFHEKASLTVEWPSRHVDVRVHRGALVTIAWLGHPACHQGAIRISRLVPLERAEAAANLFELVPYSWVPDRKLVRRGAELIDSLPRGFRHLFNAVFWDGARFERYVTGPSSLNGHHNDRNGNLRHSVEVADVALQQGCGRDAIYPPILSLGGLLHDAGKADEYRYDYGRRSYVLSDRGALIGHRQTLLEWLATARAQHRVVLPEAHYLALLHAMTAVKGAPDWLGMRMPRRLEAIILARVDSISTDADLYGRNTPQQEGFGAYHSHLNVRPYSIGNVEAQE